MKTLEVRQGSEDWDKVRCQMPTASQFGRIITAAKMALSAKRVGYMCELFAKQEGVYSPPPPTFWMEWGVENEPNAALCYERKNGVETEVVGFCMLDDESAGCSPDRLVGDTGLLEIKCPKPETLIEYHKNGELPNDYKPQVQGQLWITGREWCDFFGYHPHLPPFQLRVERDEAFIEKLASHVKTFNAEFEELKRVAVGKMGVEYLCDFTGEEVVAF